MALRDQLLGLASTAERLAFYNSLDPAEREALRRFLPREVIQELSTFEREVANSELLAAINRRLAQSEREILAMGGRPLGTPAEPVARGFRSLPRSVGELSGDILAGLRHAPIPVAIYGLIASELEGQYLRYTWEEMQAYLNAGQGLPVFVTIEGPPAWHLFRCATLSEAIGFIRHAGLGAFNLCGIRRVKWLCQVTVRLSRANTIGRDRLSKIRAGLKFRATLKS